MCPPVPPPVSEIGSSDEQIISSLNGYLRGSRLPNNVTADINPYQHDPSNLPPGIWYFIQSNEKKETAVGVWKEKGEAREIYLNAELSGSKTTLEFFDDRAPDGQETNWLMQVYKKTDWLMQVYKITQKGSRHKTEQKDSKSLCRIFRKSESQPKHNNTDVSAKCSGSVASANPTTNNSSAQYSSSKSEGKKYFEDDFQALECYGRGDFLELADLVEPESLSSSSENSTRPSGASDEYFDSLALLRDLNDGDNPGKELRKYTFPASVNLDKVVVKPAILGSLQSGNGSKPAVEGFSTGSPTEQMQKLEQRIKGTSNFDDTVKPSTSRKAVLTGEKKAVVGRMKRLKEIFCFKPFQVLTVNYPWV